MRRSSRRPEPEPEPVAAPPAPVEICSATQVDGLSVTIDGNLLTAITKLSDTVRHALDTVGVLANALRPTSVTSQMTKG